MQMIWVLQDRNFALGNFVNITPVIKWLYRQTGKPVPVYFETEYVKQCYLDSEMIRILEHHPLSTPFVSSSLICRNNSTQDFRYAFKVKTGLDYTDEWKPFVGVDLETHYLPQKYALFINGSGSERTDYVDSKNPGEAIFLRAVVQMKEAGYRTIFTGSHEDVERNPRLYMKCEKAFTGDIRRSIALIKNASFIIANDTGLAHVAGCFDKPMLVLWKNTPRVRVQNSGINTVYSYPGNWPQDIDKFINGIK